MKKILIVAIIVFIAGIASSFTKQHETAVLPTNTFTKTFSISSDLATAD